MTSYKRIKSILTVSASMLHAMVYVSLGVCLSQVECSIKQLNTLCLKKTAPLRQVGINSVIFQIQKKSEIYVL